jgi:hypothetical protein
MSDVRVTRPQRQSRLNIQSGRQVPTDFRFPGEPEDGASEQMQSWLDAAQRARAGASTLVPPPGRVDYLLNTPTDFVPGVDMNDGRRGLGLERQQGANPAGAPRNPFEGFGQGFMDYVRASPIAGLANIFPPNLLRDSFNNMLAGASSAFRSGPAAGTGTAGATGGFTPADIGMQDTGTSTPSRTIEELMALAAQYAPQPDYSQYRASLENMVLNPETGLSPRIQAMYNELAARAGENQQRVSDVYSGATENVGSVYDTSAANVSDAFTSAQQQAADQMARLGIEQAAGQVIPQAAGRQASALAALEQGRAGGLSALERYGASSGDFASQMGQVAQQRGLEQNQALLGALQRQLAESFGMEAQQRAQYNPMQGALDYLQLEQGLNPQADPRASQQEAEFLYQQEQDDTNIFRQYYQGYLDQTGGNQAAARERARADAVAGIMGPRIQQRAMSDPNFVPMASQ